MPKKLPVECNIRCDFCGAEPLVFCMKIDGTRANNIHPMRNIDYANRKPKSVKAAPTAFEQGKRR